MTLVSYRNPRRADLHCRVLAPTLSTTCHVSFRRLLAIQSAGVTGLIWVFLNMYIKPFANAKVGGDARMSIVIRATRSKKY